MKRSRYNIMVLIRIMLITLNCFVLVWLYLNTERPATTLFAFCILGIQTASLIYYHNRISRDLANFLIFLQENDTTLAFSKRRIERNFQGLIYHLDMINRKLQDARIAREQQFHYLQTVIKQIDSGILAYDQDGNVELYNQAARDLLQINSLSHLNILGKHYPELVEILLPSPHIPSEPVKLNLHGNNRILAMKAGSLNLNDRLIHLISFQDIKHELDAGELEAWRKLIRIQRHEIINSITPITTLTTAIRRRFKKGDEVMLPSEIPQEYIADALSSLEVIEERSHGLIAFVERFRNLTNLPELRSEKFRFRKIIESIILLYQKQLNSGNIQIKVSIDPENLMVNGDEKLLEQVLINLVKNSLEAVPSIGGNIEIKAFSDTHHNKVIQISDNGSGIDPSIMDSIFIPSFTTKTNGSGIGLSISRQIVQMHKGIISARSIPGVKTTFEILIPDVRPEG